MPNPLIECIPNFSEARRPEIVEAIVDCITAVQGVHILDRHSDLDHNRTVITFVGSPESVEAAAFAAIKRASELIDLNQHTGEHPRIGAADVVPFVPLQDVTMQECVELARRLAKRVGEEIPLPVYLYEEAAVRPERQNLENIRRGQFEAWKEEIGVSPERNPDFGPVQYNPAGAVVIGARAPLIAYNVYLTTNDVTIAQKIARAVRHSSGGMRYVKAMGVLVEGRAQVSMNLTNFRQTPVFRVVEMVRREAERYGVGVHHSELVGLTPQQALIQSAVWYLQLDDFQNDQLLEQRLMETIQAAPAESQPPAESSFLDQLASGTPTPGGGSAAANTAATGAALVAMVGRLTVSKKKYEAIKEQMWALIDRAEALRHGLTLAMAEDAAAFEAILAAFKLPKETEAEQAARNQAVQNATLHAAEIPLTVAAKSLEVMEMALQAAKDGNSNAITDAGTGATLAKAALTSACYNVRTNVLGLEDEAQTKRLLAAVRELESRAEAVNETLRSVLQERGGLPLS